MLDLSRKIDQLSDEHRAELITMFRHRIDLLEWLVQQLSARPARPAGGRTEVDSAPRSRPPSPTAPRD